MYLIINDGSATGWSVATLLLNDGNEVILIENKSKENELEVLTQKFKKNLTVFTANVYQTEEIQTFLDQIQFSQKLKGLVFSAGIGGVRPLKLTKTQFLNEMMNANLYAFVEWVRCTCQKNRFENGGSVVAISSVSSFKGLKSKLAYSASKAALDASIRVMAAEFADRKIRVNSIQKGWVRSDMQHDFIQDNMSLNQNQDLEKQVLGVIENEDLANTVVFLLKEQSKFITGTNLLLDGGYSLS